MNTVKGTQNVLKKIMKISIQIKKNSHRFTHLTFPKLFGTISEELKRRKLNEKYNELY